MLNEDAEEFTKKTKNEFETETLKLEFDEIKCYEVL